MDAYPTGSVRTPAFNPVESFGHEFNLVRAVSEYAPQRIDQIVRQMDTMQKEMDSLRAERKRLEALLAAVE